VHLGHSCVPHLCEARGAHRLESTQNSAASEGSAVLCLRDRAGAPPAQAFMTSHPGALLNVLDVIPLLGLQVIPRERRTQLFSATMTNKVQKLQRACLVNPVKVGAAGLAPLRAAREAPGPSCRLFSVRVHRLPGPTITQVVSPRFVCVQVVCLRGQPGMIKTTQAPPLGDDGHPSRSSLRTRRATRLPDTPCRRTSLTQSAANAPTPAPVRLCARPPSRWRWPTSTPPWTPCGSSTSLCRRSTRTATWLTCSTSSAGQQPW
jgi:hypothetical protein